jgi:hypothetical protein
MKEELKKTTTENIIISFMMYFIFGTSLVVSIREFFILTLKQFFTNDSFTNTDSVIMIMLVFYFAILIASYLTIKERK